MFGTTPDTVWCSVPGCRHRRYRRAYANFASPEGYERSAATFSMIGGVGKWCIHPSQIESANRVFAPTPEEIADAQGAIDAVAEAEAKGEGAANFNG